MLGGDALRPDQRRRWLALAEGLPGREGVDVLDIGIVRHRRDLLRRSPHSGVDGGDEVTASHNPMDYGGGWYAGRPPDKQRLPVCATFSVTGRRATSRRWWSRARRLQRQIGCAGAYIGRLLKHISVNNLTR